MAYTIIKAVQFTRVFNLNFYYFIVDMYLSVIFSSVDDVFVGV